MDGRSILQLVEHGGAVMYPLLLCSVLSVAVIIERLWALARASRATGHLGRHVRDALEEGKLAEAAALCRGADGVMAEVVRAALANSDKSPEAVDRLVQRKLGESIRKLRRNIWLLGTVGSLAPFIGLLGTVLGIIRAFENMAATGSGGFAVVAAGISEALIATAGGLLVGVLAIFAYNAFNVRINNMSAAMRDAADEIVQRLLDLGGAEGGVQRVVQSRG